MAKSHRQHAPFAVGLFLLASAHANAQQADLYSVVAQPLPPKGEVHFGSVLDLKQEPGAQPQLRGGAIARSADWVTSLYATFETERGTSVCTAALVGPQAMLTAAHCVPTSGIVSFEFASKKFTTDCEKHPDYSSNRDASADYALCKVRSTEGRPDSVDLGAGNLFERVNTDAFKNWVTPATASVPLYITLTGYGCISDIVRQNINDKKYRVGRTYFVESSNSPGRARGEAYYSPAEVNNLITVDDSAYSNLCPGDSGGPAFANVQGKRAIIGVNSRVFYRDETQTSYGASLVSATGGPSFETWASKWAKEVAKVKVCGIAGGLAGCR